MKQIKFTYQDKDYTLTFTRETVVLMESQGFRITDIQDKPMSTIPDLFAGAFLVNHRDVKRKVIDEIYASLKNKTDLIGKLGEMYSDTLMTLFDDGTDEGKGEWTADW